MKLLSIALAYILLFAQVVSAAPLLPTQQKVVYRGTLTGLTISAVDGAAFIDNATISALGGSVTRANMKLSAVDGTAFVDFSAADILTDHVANRAKLTLTDSAGKKLVGYIKAAGTGEMYGGELITNGNMEDGDPPTGWAAHNNAVLDGVADERTDGTGSQSLEVASGTTGWYALQNKTTAIGGLYRNTYWGKTISGSGFKGAFFGTGTLLNPSVTNSATWLNVVQYFVANSTNTLITASATGMSTSGGGTQRFDDFSVKQVLTPAVTGVTITSTADGSTFNWASKESGFNYNGASGYTYSFDLDTFTDGNHQIEIYDSAGRFLRGVLKAQGTGETFGSELIVNGNMETGDPPSNWTSSADAVLSSVADERTDGAGAKSLNIARGTNNLVASQSVTTTARALYKTVGWHRNVDQDTGVRFFISATSTEVSSPYYIDTSWAERVLFVNPGGATLNIALACASTGGKSGRFDDISVKQVLTPSTTGATIVSAKGGTTYNFNHKDASFTYNAASYYVIIKKIR